MTHIPVAMRQSLSSLQSDFSIILTIFTSSTSFCCIASFTYAGRSAHFDFIHTVLFYKTYITNELVLSAQTEFEGLVSGHFG